MIRRRHSVVCDAPQCGAVSTVDGSSALMARLQAEKEGWHVSGGKDICAADWAAGRRYNARLGWTLG